MRSDATDGCGRQPTARHGPAADETLVLYDQCSRSVADDVTTAAVTSQTMTSSSHHVVSVLLRRLKQDGFRVYLLDGITR